MAFRLMEEIHIAPINYAAEGRRLLFRTAAGDKLLGVVMGAEGAFEVDRFEGESARSVVVRGTAHLLSEDDERRAENVPPRSSVSTQSTTSWRSFPMS